MTEKLQQTIKEQLAGLPKEGQVAIASVDWLAITQEVGKNQNLEEGEVDDLVLETLLVLAGITDPEFFAVNIENQVNTTTEKAKILAEELANKVFLPIRKVLDENIKKDLQNKNVDWKQNVDFVLSGGDYGAFVEKRDTQPTTPVQSKDNAMLTPRMIDIKNRPGI